jgi:hypothetical protein
LNKFSVLRYKSTVLRKILEFLPPGTHPNGRIFLKRMSLAGHPVKQWNKWHPFQESEKKEGRREGLMSREKVCKTRDSILRIGGFLGEAKTKIYE